MPNKLFRTLIISLCCVLVASTAACGKSNTETELSAAQMLTLVYDSQGYTEDMTVLVYPSEAFNKYIKNTFDILPEDINDGVVAYYGGAKGDEIVILYLKEAKMTDKAEESMRQYIAGRIEHFNGYVPEVFLMLNEATVATRGSHIALLMCPDPAGAQKAFFSAFDSDLTSPPAMQETRKDDPVPEKEDDDTAGEEVTIAADWDYDHNAILKAWTTGDKQSLSEKDLFILERSQEILEEIIHEDMSDYERELAAHDWIINWADYDEKALDTYDGDDQDPDNANPYGVFVNQRAICKGYTSTFQLFMDMLNIECITVNGLANADQEEHAWNMVRLDGEWYCVDVTWDDPIASFEIDEKYKHTYFNVTSQFLRDTTHRWDESSVPEATADKYKWHGLLE